jgi:2-phospho-L-lactate guanylyltransferase
MRAHAAIAVRGGAAAKSRCEMALGPLERDELVRAMLCDMVEALLASPSITAVHVVTPTAALAQAAEAAGASVLLEPHPRGVNAAFEAARAQIRASDAEAVVAALPGDLPLIEAGEIEAVLAQLSPGCALIVPASADGGTGAVIAPASAGFSFQFGPDSFRRHLDAVAAAGLTPRVVRSPSLGLDIDRPEDLDLVLGRGARGRTAALLERLAHLMEASR